MPKWLSKDALQVIRAAEQEARARRQAVGTPHLLLGLVERDGEAAAVLRSMGISVRDVQYEAARKLGRVASKPARGRPAYSSKVEAIFARAVTEAAEQGRHKVEPVDLLLALVAEPQGKASSILASLRPVRDDDDMVGVTA